MLRWNLHTKFLILVLGCLLVFFGILSSIIVQREARLLAEKADEKQHVLAYAIVADLKDSMMTNRPRSTMTMMKSLRGAYGLVRLEVLRRDGSLAFESTGDRLDIPQLRDAFLNGEETHFQETGEMPVRTIIIPLRNTFDCRVCHEQDAPVLGAVVISLSLEDSIREIVHSKRDLTALLSLIMLLIGGVLYLVLRLVVLRPLTMLHEGAERIGKGDFTRRISLATRDELQDLATAFNDMAGRINASHAELENRIQERTGQLLVAKDELQEKAMRLYAYGHDLATISRLSTKIFSAGRSLDELLDIFMRNVTYGLDYRRAMICLVDRKRVWLEVKRDTGVGEMLHFRSCSLLSDSPLVEIVRNARIAVIEEGDPKFGSTGRAADASTLLILPLLNRTQTKKCWQITSCIKTDCPAYTNQDRPCWLTNNTLCANLLTESHDNKLASCMTCKVFPVMGALVVATGDQKTSRRRNQLSVLRILTSEMAAALDNHRLHEENQAMVRELMELHRVTASALSELSANRSLELFTDTALKMSGIDACSFWLYSPDSGWLDRKASGSVDEGETGDLFPDRLPLDDGLMGCAMKQPGFVVNYDLARNDPTPLSLSATAQGLNTILAIPLKRGDTSIGVFAVHKRDTLPFLETEIASFLLLANQSAMAVNVCLLNDELRKKNIRQIQHSNLLSGILASMSSGVMLLDNSSTVLLVNLVGASILRTRQENLMDKRLTDRHPEATAFLSRLNDPHQEIELQLHDGTRVPIGFTSTRYQGASGVQEGVIVVYRDLSEVKALEAELLNKERFAAMGRVVAGVAHEIRNPLFGISSVGQILERELTGPAHLELVRALLSETRRMNQLVEELLQYGRPMRLNRAWCDVQGLWNEVYTMHREELERRGITFNGDIHAGQLPAYLDANQVRQVFLNLIRNAIDATPEGGLISIRLMLQDELIVFRISDTGIGIPLENLRRIFDLFFTTKPKGTGLGLAICRKIAQDHGGEITVESNAEKGTAVTVKLPYHAAEQPGAST